MLKVVEQRKFCCNHTTEQSLSRLWGACVNSVRSDLVILIECVVN